MNLEAYIPTIVYDSLSLYPGRLETYNNDIIIYYPYGGKEYRSVVYYLINEVDGMAERNGFLDNFYHKERYDIQARPILIFVKSKDAFLTNYIEIEKKIRAEGNSASLDRFLACYGMKNSEDMFDFFLREPDMFKTAVFNGWNAEINQELISKINIIKGTNLIFISDNKNTHNSMENLFDIMKTNACLTEENFLLVIDEKDDCKERNLLFLQNTLRLMFLTMRI